MLCHKIGLLNIYLVIISKFQRGTAELMKYLRGKMPEAPEEAPDKVKGIWSYKGQSGIIGGDAGGIKAHEVQQSKILNLRCN